MAVEKVPILIAEHDADFAQVLEDMLSLEGYEATVLVFPADLVAAVRQYRPRAMVLDLLPLHTDPFRMLDALRADEVARRAPILVMATSEQLAQQSLASFNVRESVTKPFHLGELLEKLGRMVDRPTVFAGLPPGAHPDGVLELAERVLAERSREALFRWVQRLRQEPPWRDRPDLKLAELLDGVPLLVKALDVALHYESPEAFFERQPEALERVREHARLRRGQDIPLSALIHEYTLLRNELWHLFRAYLPRQIDIEDVFRLEEAINLMLDRIIEHTIPTYVELIS